MGQGHPISACPFLRLHLEILRQILVRMSPSSSSSSSSTISSSIATAPVPSVSLSILLRRWGRAEVEGQAPRPRGPRSGGLLGGEWVHVEAVVLADQSAEALSVLEVAEGPSVRHEAGAQGVQGGGVPDHDPAALGGGRGDAHGVQRAVQVHASVGQRQAVQVAGAQHLQGQTVVRSVAGHQFLGQQVQVHLLLAVCREVLDGEGETVVLTIQQFLDDGLIIGGLSVCPVVFFPVIGSMVGCIEERWLQATQGRATDADVGVPLRRGLVAEHALREGQDDCPYFAAQELEPRLAEVGQE